MERWNFKEEIMYLASINSFGKDFFGQTNFLKKISNTLSIQEGKLDNFKEGIHYIQEGLCTNSLHMNDQNRQRTLTKKIEPELMLFLISYDEAKHLQYRLKTQRAIIEINGKFCPVLLDKNDEIMLCTISYLFYNMYNLINKDYWDIPSTYSNISGRKRNIWKEFYKEIVEVNIHKI
jgi:hypothetical protein